MLDFTDAPYQFFPPKPSRPFMALCRTVNRAISLRKPGHRVLDVEVHGGTSALDELRRNGNRVLFVANHSTHSDPQALTEVQRRAGFSSCYLAAYDVFLRNRLVAWVMQHNGAFSIDRDGADRRSMQTAVDILRDGKFALTIFPEGNVFFTNDRTSGFLPGAAFIATKAQKAVGAGEPVFVVPVSLKFTYVEDVRPRVLDTLQAIARAVGSDLDAAAPPASELARIGLLLLSRSLKQRGHWPDGHVPEGAGLFDALRDSAERILSGLEKKMEINPRPGDPPAARAAKIRAGVHQVLSDPERAIDHRSAAAWGDEAILAIRILGYGTPYVAEKPTLDRFAETVEKLREDLYSKPGHPFGTRRALAYIGEPLDLRDAAGAPEGKKTSLGELNRELESRVQLGIDTLNAANRAEGGKPM